MKKIFKHFILFIFGGLLYLLVELLYRSHTHFTMGIVGGICFLIVGGINEFLDWDTPFYLQCILGSISVTIIEFISGIILNKILNLHIWDYSNLPFNLLGQVCLQFSLLWILLSGVAIILDDYLRYFLFNEEKPRYNFCLFRKNLLYYNKKEGGK